MSRGIAAAYYVGNLTRDCEKKYLPSGTCLVTFSIAVSEKRKVKDNWEDAVSYFDVEFWGKPAESRSEYLTKGQKVFCRGMLRQDRWEKDGHARSKVVLRADNVLLIGGSKASHHVEDKVQEMFGGDITEEDVPF